MEISQASGMQHFKNEVGLKFQLYNSLFTSLPFYRIERTGILLSLLHNNCADGYENNESPSQIIDNFFSAHTNLKKEQDKQDLLFRFVQYIERQVVLFDALEDAAFPRINDMQGAGTLKQLLGDADHFGKEEELLKKINDYSVRLVLTAHPTQFYPGTVLGIINDLSNALSENNSGQINSYLQQLGKTPFFKKQKPTPYDEAMSLVWYLENVFYKSAGKIYTTIKNQLQLGIDFDKPLIQMGFWPGGDRDGNPFVVAETTLKVSSALRGAIIKCYYMDVRSLKRRLTFDGIEPLLTKLENELYNNIFIPGQTTKLTKDEIISTLTEIRQIIVHQHNGLFLHLVDQLINRVQIFGLYFASLDIRQESTVHGKVLANVAAQQKIKSYPYLPDYKLSIDSSISDEMVNDTLETIKSIKTIQKTNGEQGCERYIISQCSSAKNVMEVFQLFMLCGWKEDKLSVDIIPLFETVEDLQQAGTIMQELYDNKIYRKHLSRRKNRQTIMLGFSDGTKDGGYLMANWAIYKAKEDLSRISQLNGIDVVFFDGRGGPPARGGGKTHKFYASMGENISNKEIQLTVQGQTVSSNFGTKDAAQYNIEQLLNAGISNDLFSSSKIMLSAEEEDLFVELSEISFDAYKKLKEHPDFMEYLIDTSPLKYYSETNIASRPTKRRTAEKLQLKDLRAIPYVGAWSQIKQNVTGYYGLGSALQAIDKAGQFKKAKKLYRQSLFLKTLLDNCEMAMKKTFFPLTQHLSDHPRYGEIWNLIHEEYELTKKYILKLSGKKELMQDYPVERISIEMRERIVMPLTTIQQYAIAKRNAAANKQEAEIYEKLIIRSSFGIINAARNSA